MALGKGEPAVGAKMSLPTPSKRSANFVTRVCDDPTALVDLMARTGADDLAEQLQALASKELARLWATLSEHVDALIGRDEHRADEAADGAMGGAAHTGAIGFFEAVVELARQTLACEAVTPPEQMHAAAFALHDIIFELESESAAELQDAIVRLCEGWWHAGAAGRESLVPQAVTYVLVRALGADAGSADVKRAAAFRGALAALDFADPSIGSLKKLLLHALISPRFLRHADGRRCLVSLWTLDPGFVAELHAAVKNQLPVCRASLRAAYADVYARAWRAASGDFASAIEAECLQDLMHAAAHARTSAMAAAVRAALAEVHALKGTSRAADEMLVRLYEPILWRSLKVPNPLVRRNAAALLFDVFPLAPPAAHGARALDEAAQRSWGAVRALLKDEAPAVRALAAHGAARCLALYAELAPPGTPKAVAHGLGAELAHDAASAAVRVAALDALGFLVAQAAPPRAKKGGAQKGGATGARKGAAPPPGSAAAAGADEDGAAGVSGAVQLALRAALPHVAPLAHDSCERVRAALLRLLARLRALRTPAWHALVSADALARRLPLERPPLRRQLVALLAPLYLPTAGGGGGGGAGGGGAAARPLARLRELCAAQPLCARALLQSEATHTAHGGDVLARALGALLDDALGAAARAGGGAADEGARALGAALGAASALLEGEAAAAVARGGGARGAAAARPLATLAAARIDARAGERLWAAAAPSADARGALRAIAARLPEGSVPAVSAECAAVLPAVMSPHAPSPHARMDAAARADAHPPVTAPLGAADADADGAGAAAAQSGVLACVCAWQRAGPLLGSVLAALRMTAAVAAAQEEGGGDLGGAAASDENGGGAARAGGKRARQQQQQQRAQPPAPPAASAAEHAAAAERAASLLLQLLASAPLRAQLLSAPEQRAALGAIGAELERWLPALRARLGAPAPLGGAAASARAHAVAQLSAQGALRLVRALGKLATHLALPHGDDDDDDAEGRARALRLLRSLGAWGCELARDASARGFGAPASAAGAVPAASRALRAVQAAAPPPADTPPRARPRRAEPAEAEGAARADAVGWACAALVACVDAHADAAAVGLCAAPEGGAEAGALARAAAECACAALGACSARAAAGGSSAHVCAQRRALALAWQLLDGGAAEEGGVGEGSEADAEGAPAAAQLSAQIVRAAAAAAPRAAAAIDAALRADGADADALDARTNLQLSAAELRAGTSALLALCAHAPHARVGALVCALIGAALDARAALGAAPGGARGADDADADVDADAEGARGVALVPTLGLPPLPTAALEALARASSGGSGSGASAELGRAVAAELEALRVAEPSADAPDAAWLCRLGRALGCSEPQLLRARAC